MNTVAAALPRKSLTPVEWEFLKQGNRILLDQSNGWIAAAALMDRDIAKIRRVYVLRDKVAHDTFEVDQAALAQFLADVEHQLAELKPDDDPDTATRKRIRKADIVDEEMYEWLKKEAANRMEAQRVSPSDAQPATVAKPATQTAPSQHGSADHPWLSS